MIVIKNINNNVALCRDESGREVIAFGKGIGFIKPPFKIQLAQIERTFYDFSEVDLGIIQEISSNAFKASIRIVESVERNLNTVLMPTTTLALADHINFSLQRLEKGIRLDIAIQEDLKQLYPEAMVEARKALDIIDEETGKRLEAEEVGLIALHFINNQIKTSCTDEILFIEILKACTKIIETQFDIVLNTDSFNYSRFVTHLDYLLKRSVKNNQIESKNIKLYHSLKLEYPQSIECAIEISRLFEKELQVVLGDEEKLYLVLHINRLCSRQK